MPTKAFGKLQTVRVIKYLRVLLLVRLYKNIPPIELHNTTAAELVYDFSSFVGNDWKLKADSALIRNYMPNDKRGLRESHDSRLI